MEDKFLCKFCELEYDTQEKTPRILKQCGHCICQQCLNSYISNGVDIVCPVDNVDIPIQGQTLDNFPINLSLIHILKIKQEPKQVQDSDDGGYFSDFSGSSQEDSFAQFQTRQINEPSSEEIKTVQTSRKKFIEQQQQSNIDDEVSESNDELTEFCHIHNMKIDVICLDCAEKMCDRCALFDGHKVHNVKMKKEFMEQIEEEKETIQKHLNNMEKQENYLKGSLVDEIFKPQKNKKILQLKQNINDLYEKALYLLSKHREEMIKKIDKGFDQKQEELRDRLQNEFKEQNKQNEQVKKKLKMLIKLYGNYFSNEQIIIDKNKEQIPTKTLKKSQKIIENQTTKITYYQQQIENFFEQVDKKTKVNMIVKGSKLKIPKFNLNDSQNMSFNSENKSLYDFEEEVDLINMEIPKPNPQLSFLDQVNQTQQNNSFVQNTQPQNKMPRTNSLNFLHIGFNRNTVRQERKSSIIRHKNTLSIRKDQAQQSMISLQRSLNDQSQDLLQTPRNLIKKKTLQSNFQFNDTNLMNKNESQLSENKQEQLTEILQEFASKELECLNLENMKLTNSDLPLLTQNIRFNNNIKILKLNDNELNSKDMEEIRNFMEDLHNNKTIEEIDFSNNVKMTSNILSELLKVIKKNPGKIKRILFRNNNIKESNQIKGEEHFAKYFCEIIFQQIIIIQKQIFIQNYKLIQHSQFRVGIFYTFYSYHFLYQSFFNF